MRWMLAFALAWILGSLPFGLWAGRLLRGIDVRHHGSGNLGATNVYRVLGPGPGIAVLLLDAAKGVAAVLAARAVLGEAAGAVVGPASLLAAVLGHSFSPFAGLRGGKGVATAAGAWGVLAPLPLAIALASWILVFAATRIVSAASVTASLVLPLAVGVSRGWRWQDPILWTAVLTGILILARHRSNLTRLRKGREKRLDLQGARRGDRPGPTST